MGEKMNTKTANALGDYFETLFETNRNLIMFCGIDIYGDTLWQQQEIIRSVICSIPQLIPYSAGKNGNGYRIVDRDGLLEFSEDLPFLKKDYENLLEHHMLFLKKIKTIRNKCEHKMHGADLTSAGAGTFIEFELVYHTGQQEITVYSGEFISLMKDLNILFYKIQSTLREFVFKEEKQYHPYYQRLMRLDFADFNKIYDSDLLRVIGRSFLPC